MCIYICACVCVHTVVWMGALHVGTKKMCMCEWVYMCMCECVYISCSMYGCVHVFQVHVFMH